MCILSSLKRTFDGVESTANTPQTEPYIRTFQEHHRQNPILELSRKSYRRQRLENLFGIQATAGGGGLLFTGFGSLQFGLHGVLFYSPLEGLQLGVEDIQITLLSCL